MSYFVSLSVSSLVSPCVFFQNQQYLSKRPSLFAWFTSGVPRGSSGAKDDLRCKTTFDGRRPSMWGAFLGKYNLTIVEMGEEDMGLGAMMPNHIPNSLLTPLYGIFYELINGRPFFYVYQVVKLLWQPKISQDSQISYFFALISNFHAKRGSQ